MKKNSIIKKIILGAAALVVLFAPVGLNMNGNSANSHSSSASFSLGVNRAFAITPLPEPTPTPTPTPAPVQGNSASNSAPTPQTPNFLSCIGSNGSSLATCSVYFIAETVNGFIALFVTLGALLVQFGLQLNDNVFNSPAVQTGFSVMLAIANLGFVLGIIIIALATILRNQTYGIKQLLWKLVVMAILINFGLVICAPIVGAANSLSNYFIQASSPVGTTGYQGYVTTITNAFSPQSVNANLPTTAASTPTIAGTAASTACSLFGGNSSVCDLAASLANKIVGPADVFTQQLNALFFGIAFSSLSAFTFLCLAILLLVRYLMLAGLLIVLPVAWLTFIFPKYDSNFSKWWTTFIRWTVFPPVALFFIYLALITVANVPGTANNPNYLQQAAGLPTTAATGPAGALVYQTGLGGPIQQSMDEVLLVGLMVMGLMFASSLSGKAGSTVVDAGKGAAKFVGGYAGKQAKKGARAGFRAAGGAKAVENLRAGKLGGLQRIPGLGRVASLAGRAAEPHLTNKDILEEAKKKVPDNTEQVKQNLQGSMNTEDQLAHLAKLIEKGELSKDQMVNGKNVADFLDKNQAMIKNYGFEKSAKDADKILLSTVNSRNADRAIKDGKSEVVVEKTVKGENGEDLYKAGDKVDPALLKKEAEREFYQDNQKSDFSKANVNELFGTKEALKNPGEFLNKIKNVADYRPEAAADLMKKMNALTLQKFAESYEGTLKTIIADNKSRKDILDKLGTARTARQNEEFIRLVAKVKRSETGMNQFAKAYKSVFGNPGGSDEGGGGSGSKDKGDDKKH